MMVPIFLCWIALIFSGLTFSAIGFAKTPRDYLAEFSDSNATDAYKDYWQGFESYEKHRLKSQREDLRKSLIALDEQFDSANYQINEKQLDLLKRALEQYQKHLSDYPSARNTPYVMLNIAQIQSRIGDHYQQADRSLSMSFKQQALDVLTDLERDFPNFEKKNESLYLRALLLSSMGEDVRAQQLWEALAASNQGDIVVLYANLAVGDYYFEKEKPDLAYSAYKKAKSIFRNHKSVSRVYPKLKIDYRLAWASYRSANLRECVEHTIDIIESHSSNGRIKVEDGVRSDAVDLLSDALFELNDADFTTRVLEKKIPTHLGSNALFGILKRYFSSGIYDEVIELGEFAVTSYPTSEEFPDILTILADSYRRQNQESKYLETLELLAMMLPNDSLWRMRNSSVSTKIQKMQDKAVAAAVILAGKHYQKGMLTRSLSYFNRASSFYDLLIEMFPGHKDLFDWKVKRANCAYFAGNLNDADRIYGDIKKSVEKNPDLLLMASYQQVVTREKMWRQTLEDNVGAGSPSANPIVIERLRYLEESVEDFANKFPDTNRAVDLLLMAASANYDLNKDLMASRFWQRVLVSKPNKQQREMAIRGIVSIQVESDDYEENIRVIRRFVDLESDPGLNRLRADLLVILADQVQKYTTKLNGQGNYKQSADLIVSELQGAQALPGFEKSMRDAGYYYAMGQSWKDALRIADDYLATSLSSYRSDMLYLRAKSLEYLLKFDESSKAYIELARAYPDHVKSDLAAKRAYELAKSSDDFNLAARALKIRSNVKASKLEKTELLLKSAELHFKNGDYEAAFQQYKDIVRLTKQIDVKYRAELVAEIARYKSGDESKALNNVEALLKKYIRDEDKLGANTYREIVSKASLFLAQEKLEKFHDYQIDQRGVDVVSSLKDKLRIFDEISNQMRLPISLKSEEYMPMARFQLGYAAEILADEISALRLSGSNLSSGIVNDLIKQSDRLRDMAKKYYLANVSLSESRPDLYAKNHWIYQSKIKVSSNPGKNLSDLNETFLPFSLSDEFPYRWSY